MAGGPQFPSNRSTSEFFATFFSEEPAQLQPRPANRSAVATQSQPAGQKTAGDTQEKGQSRLRRSQFKVQMRRCGQVMERARESEEVNNALILNKSLQCAK